MTIPSMGGPGPVPAAETLDLQRGIQRLNQLQPRVQGGQDQEAARDFEAMVLSMLVKEMRKTLPDGLFGKAPGAGVFEGLFDQMMGESLASGRGLGLREQLLADMNPTVGAVEEEASSRVISDV